MFAVPLLLLGVGIEVLLGRLNGEQCKTDECNPYSVRPPLVTKKADQNVGEEGTLARMYRRAGR